MTNLIFALLQQGSDFSTSTEGREYMPPDGPIFYIVLIGAALLVLATIVLSVKWLIWPGEKSDDHIKRIILKGDSNESQNNE